MTLVVESMRIGGAFLFQGEALAETVGTISDDTRASPEILLQVGQLIITLRSVGLLTQTTWHSLPLGTGLL